MEQKVLQYARFVDTPHLVSIGDIMSGLMIFDSNEISQSKIKIVLATYFVLTMSLALVAYSFVVANQAELSWNQDFCLESKGIKSEFKRNQIAVKVISVLVKTKIM